MADTKHVTLTVDGAQIRAPQGTSVLDAALDHGICIPNLCYLPGCKAIGACRVCVVEMEVRGRMKMTASCTLEARNGMVIHAHSDNVIRARKNIVELLWAEASEDPVCSDTRVRRDCLGHQHAPNPRS